MTERVDNMLVHERPEVHVVGESLGATAGQAVSSGSGAERPRSVCSVLWTGTPGGHRVGLPHEDRRWLPVVSAVHSAADVVGSLEVPDGSGHRYGPEQADRLATCSSTG